MKSFTIGKNDANQRLDKFITKTVPALPKTLMYKYIRIKRIKINGKKGDIALKLKVGDFVEMYINDEFFVPSETRYDFMSASKNVDIIYEDDNIILLNKKVGLLAHPDNTEYVDTLITRVKHYLYAKKEYDPKDENSFTPSLVNRIDRNTSGIVICAKTASALRILNQKMKDRELSKIYLCVVHGKPKKDEDLMVDYLFKDEKKNKVFVSKNQVIGSKVIKTKYKVLGSRDGLSLVEIDLLTGRTHQIRAHMAHIGNPLLGDGKYGTNALNKKTGYKKQCLCSYKLKFNFTTDAGELEYLNGKEFFIKDVWFQTEFLNGKLQDTNTAKGAK